MSIDRARVAVVGDRLSKFVAQDSIEVALEHSARALGASVETEWFDTPKLATHAAEQLRDFDAVWCAPGSPYLNLDGALAGIRVARESRRPFLGTCAGFQHGVIEFARNVIGAEHAHHAEWGPVRGDAPLFIDELQCSLVGQVMHVRVVDDATRDLYGAADVVEEYYCRFGLNEEHLPALRAAGLEVAGVDSTDNTTRIMRLVTHPFFYLTLFVPQTASRPGAPHPVVTAYLGATLNSLRQ